MLIASNGHFLTQIPQPERQMSQEIWVQLHINQVPREIGTNLPIHRGSEMKASLLFGPTSIQSFPSLTTGQDFLHS